MNRLQKLLEILGKPFLNALLLNNMCVFLFLHCFILINGCYIKT